MIKPYRTLLIAIAASTAISGAALAQDITLMADDGFLNNPSFNAIVEQFEEENPGISVERRFVSYQTIVESLPLQLAAGEGPDIAAVTDLGGLSEYYLDLRDYVDAEYFTSQFGRTLGWLRGERGGDGIYGVPLDLSVNSGFINNTLFEQAGVEVPGEGATWEEWADATQAVTDATGLEFAMEMDRSGHRFASLAISYGAELVDKKGNPIVDDGLRAAIEQFVAWHDEGVMPLDLWGAVGGSTHRVNFADFTNAATPFYFSGSWQLANVEREVSGLFDWQAIPAPCGPSSCTVMPGGVAVVGFAHTDEPAATAKFLEFLAREDTLRRFYVETNNLPTAISLQEEGIEYKEASEKVQMALDTMINQIPKMADAAYRFQGWAYQRAMMNALTTRVSQVINDELTVDQALDRIEQDVLLAKEAAE